MQKKKKYPYISLFGKKVRTTATVKAHFSGQPPSLFGTNSYSKYLDHVDYNVHILISLTIVFVFLGGEGDLQCMEIMRKV